ncbi:hypothetical protein PHIN109289_14820 [Phaeobacter inhibens]
MTDINELRAPVLAINSLPNVDCTYTMHYDETNNIQRLHLTPNGLNVRAPQCFVLDGIAHRDAPPLLEFEDLRQCSGFRTRRKNLNWTCRGLMPLL